ncbi:unnamed protein product [Didymodactylos carnosus]|uniref:Uncharacterized protein n=1 Tax=Didymodactylos carnosus TaxID=1234261 RepID=A0A815IBW5_9BILA|nr:unnamed protein product [Didymodactylos carnosus]CAF4240638.1 unnamed protein product [Didymodactylos carnosus]
MQNEEKLSQDAYDKAIDTTLVQHERRTSSTDSLPLLISSTTKSLLRTTVTTNAPPSPQKIIVLHPEPEEQSKWTKEQSLKWLRECKLEQGICAVSEDYDDEALVSEEKAIELENNVS